jgi:hypothetical protein
MLFFPSVLLNILCPNSVTYCGESPVEDSCEGGGGGKALMRICVVTFH